MVEGLVETVRIKERNSYVHKVHASQRLCDISRFVLMECLLVRATLQNEFAFEITVVRQG